MNKKIKVAVVGVHGFGSFHVDGFSKNANAKLVAVCDVNEEYAKECGEKYGICYTTDFNDILNNSEITAVSIAVPDQEHCKLVVKALRAGKDVLCEKPLALKLEQCKEMIAVAKETGKYLMVGQICRFTPGFVKAKKLVDDGEIGELFFVESEYAHDYSEMECEWRKNDPERDGMIGGACHAVDLLRWIVGNPTEVFAYANHKVLTDWPTNDCTISVLKFPNDTIGKVFCSTGCKRNYTMRTVLYGTEGTIIVDNTSDTLSLFKNDLKGDKDFLNEKTKGLEIKIPVQISNHNINDEINEFCSCIAEGREPLLNPGAGAATVSICLSIIESAKKGVPMPVDYNF